MTTTSLAILPQPIPFTRAFVSIEATIGVVSLGLFLNAITYQREEKHEQLMDAYESKKSLDAFARLHSHDSLITLNMNTYLNRVN